MHMIEERLAIQKNITRIASSCIPEVSTITGFWSPASHICLFTLAETAHTILHSQQFSVVNL